MDEAETFINFIRVSMGIKENIVISSNEIDAFLLCDNL
jgi:hypothetical protein